MCPRGTVLEAASVRSGILAAMATFEFNSPAVSRPSSGVLVANTTSRKLIVSLTLNVVVAGRGGATLVGLTGAHVVRVEHGGYFGVIMLEVGPGNVTESAHLTIALEGSVPFCGVDVLSVTPV